VCAAYPRLDSDMVSCHMDPKPENLLFDGQRLWLVDWQAAFVNDRYFDLAVAANFLVAADADELTYLERILANGQTSTNVRDSSLSVRSCTCSPPRFS